VHDEKWIGVRAAERDENTRYVIDTVSAEDTAQAAAALAIAARVFAPFERAHPGFASKCRDAAVRSWQYVTTHSYDGRDSGGDLDCLFWAAAEIYRTTGEARFGEFVKRSCAGVRFNSTWTSLYYCDVQLLGMHTYACTPGADARIRDAYVSRMVALAEQREAVQAGNGYASPLGHYPWMSNAFVLGDAMLFLMTDRVSGGATKFTQCAVDCLSYVLGRNCHNTSFVTSVGSAYPRFPFHQPSMADGIAEPVPGIMVGGPNGNHSAFFGTKFPARAWQDCGYFLNEPKKDLKNYLYQEPSIASTAPLVFVAAALNPATR
jgi:endoglucanase